MSHFRSQSVQNNSGARDCHYQQNCILKGDRIYDVTKFGSKAANNMMQSMLMKTCKQKISSDNPLTVMKSDSNAYNVQGVKSLPIGFCKVASNRAGQNLSQKLEKSLISSILDIPLPIAGQKVDAFKITSNTIPRIQLYKNIIKECNAANLNEAILKSQQNNDKEKEKQIVKVQMQQNQKKYVMKVAQQVLRRVRHQTKINDYEKPIAKPHCLLLNKNQKQTLPSENTHDINLKGDKILTLNNDQQLDVPEQQEEQTNIKKVEKIQFLTLEADNLENKVPQDLDLISPIASGNLQQNTIQEQKSTQKFFYNEMRNLEKLQKNYEENSRYLNESQQHFSNQISPRTVNASASKVYCHSVDNRNAKKAIDKNKNAPTVSLQSSVGTKNECEQFQQYKLKLQYDKRKKTFSQNQNDKQIESDNLLQSRRQIEMRNRIAFSKSMRHFHSELYKYCSYGWQRTDFKKRRMEEIGLIDQYNQQVLKIQTLEQNVPDLTGKKIFLQNANQIQKNRLAQCQKTSDFISAMAKQMKDQDDFFERRLEFIGKAAFSL